MTIFVAEPRDSTRNKGFKKPQPLVAAYQRGGSQHSDLCNLANQHKACIYFSDDIEADFGADSYEEYLAYHQVAYGTQKDVVTRSQFLIIREYFAENEGL